MPFIIDPKPQQSVVKEAICKDWCGVKVGYLPSDVSKEAYFCYDGSKDIVRFIKCPNCGHKISVP